MAEVPVASLDSRQQKLVENARLALERGNFDYVIEVTAQILKSAPGCLAVRKLQRVAHLREHRGKSGGLVARAITGLSAAPFLLASRKSPAEQLATAEAVLAKDPTSVTGLKLLAEAATAMSLPETVAFALDAIREIEPKNRANLLALGEAWLAASRPAEALKIADEMLALRPADAEAQNLMRKASVAETVTKTGWQNQSSYREKLRDEKAAVALEQSAKLVAADNATQRLLDEALARVTKEPNNLNHYRSVAQAYRQLGNLPESLAWIRKAREQPAGRGDPALEKLESELAITLLEQRVKAAETAAAAAPTDAGAGSAVDAAKRELGEFRLGEARRYVERYPNDHAARCTYGNLLLELGQIDAAIAQFQQAQKGPQVRIASLVGLGRCFKAKRLYDLAVAQFGTAKADLGSLDDAKKDVIYELGACYELMGKPDAAIAEFKAIYSEDIGFRDVAEKINSFYSRA